MKWLQWSLHALRLVEVDVNNFHDAFTVHVLSYISWTCGGHISVCALCKKTHVMR